MASTRTETFGASDEHGDLDYVLRGAPNPNSDYGKGRHKPIVIARTEPVKHAKKPIEKPMQGRSNGGHLLRPDEVQKGVSEKVIIDQQAVNEIGVTAAKAMLDTQEQGTLFDESGAQSYDETEAVVPIDPVDQAGLASVRAQLQKPGQGSA